MEAIWKQRSKPISQDKPHIDDDLEVNILRECEDLINSPQKVNFEYVAEGRANAVFSVWESKDPTAPKGRFEGTLLRVPKATLGVTPCDYETLQEFHEGQVEDRVGRQHLVPQALIQISAEVAGILHQKRNKMDESGDSGRLRHADPRHEYVTWLFGSRVQAQVAGAVADRPVGCKSAVGRGAREAFRNNQKLTKGQVVSVPICPLGLMHENPGIVMDTIKRLAPEWTGRDQKRLAKRLK